MACITQLGGIYMPFMFIREFIKNRRSIGAICPSSNKLSETMLQPIQWNDVKVIIEAGAGTGVLTKKIIERKKENTKFFIFETNETFYQLLEQKYGHYNHVTVIHGDVAELNQTLSVHGITEVDYILSGIPFTSLGTKKSTLIFQQFQDALSEKGALILFQYSIYCQHMIKSFFDITHRKMVIKNAPPAIVFTCKNKNSITEKRQDPSFP